MKSTKFWVLFSLFILPLVFYIFLSKGIYRYANLPILTNEVMNVSAIDETEKASFNNNINVVCFLGNDIKTAKGSIFNLNEIIYKRYYQKPFFKVIAIIPKESEEAYKSVINELSAYTDTSKWNFVYTNSQNIELIFDSFKTPFKLNDNFYSENAFIIDKKLRLRGRKDDEDSANGKLYGYNMKSVAVLKNKMRDDIDIIYYQLKKSAEKEARRNQ